MENLLKKLKHIHPSENFQQQSKMLILSQPQNEKIGFWQLPQYSLSMGAALAVLLAILASNFGSQPQSAKLSSLDPEKLNEEIKNLDIQIQLSQAKYYEESVKKIEVALNEASGQSPANSPDPTL